MEPRDTFLLESIVDYCNRILRNIDEHGDSFEVFDSDLDFQDVCAFRVIQIGENVNELSERFKDNHPETPWHKIVGLRNILTHPYGKIDNQVMWDTLKRHIEPLRDFCLEQIEQD